MGAGAIIGAIVAGGAKATGLAFASYTYAGTMLVGASIGRTFDKQKGASPTYSFGELDNTRGQRVPIPVTYGKVKVAGNVIYQRVSDDSKELFMVIGLGEGPIESVEDIRVNDEPITSIKGYVEHHVRLGTEDQSAVSWVDTGETWPNTAYIAVKFKASEDLTMTPTITCVVKGRRIRTWNGSRWVNQYSNNPAWCILDLLTNERYSVGIKERYIDLDSFKSEALYCDELVDDGKGGQEPRFRLDYNVDFQRSSLDLIDEILSTFRAYILYSDGKLRLQIEKSQMPVQSYTMDNIVADSFSYSMASLKEIPNRVRVEWIDPESNWEQADITYDNEIDQEDREEVLETAITLYGVTRPGQAGREARWYHDSVYICNTFCEFRVGIDSMHCEAGDIIKVSHDVPGWVEKEFRILEIQEEENDEMVLRCREYNSAIYHDRGSVYTQGRGTELPNPNRPPAAVTNLMVVETGKQLKDGTWIPQALVSWDVPDDILYRAAHVYHSTDKGVNWQYIQRVADATSYLMDVPLGENRFRVVSEGSKGITGDPGSSPVATITIVGKETPPPSVEWSECSFVTRVALNWNQVTAHDLQAYEVRTDQNWGNQAGLVYRGLDLSHVIEHPTQRSYTFYVKALDRSGNYSEHATPITLSLPAPNPPPVPTLTPYFNAVEIKVNPLDSPAIMGYWGYVTKGDTTDRIPLLVSDSIAYPVETGETITVRVSAYDVIGEGAKSTIAQATTIALTDGDIPDDIVGPSKLTEDLRSDIDLSKTQSAEAISLVGGFDDRITATETVLEDASQRLESAETELGAIDGKLTTQETKITNIEGELASKVSSTEFDVLAGTVSSHGTQISQNATAIQSKADKSAVDTLAGTVSNHGTTLTQHAIAIEAKAEKSTVDTLAGRVTTAEGNITTQAGQIALKANASDVYTKTQINTELGKKADKTAVDGLTTRVTDAELTINAHTGQIAQKVERTEVYTKAETDAKLGTKVDTTTYNQKVGELTTSIDGITGRVSNTETNINNLTGEVNSVKSDVSQLEIKADGIQSTVTSLDAKVDGIEIGGRNLLLDSRELKNTGGLAPGISRRINEEGHLEITAAPGNSNYASGLGIVINPEHGLQNGDAITVSVKVKSEDATGIPTLYLGSGMGYLRFKGEIGPEFSTIQYTRVWNGPHWSPHMGFSGISGTFVFKEIKLEKGNKATDWTPAPEDVEAEINTVSTQVTQLADRYSVKTQKTSGGKTYATGFVSGINEQNESEFAVLADRFRVFGTTTSNGQAIFAVDTVTKKAYFLADLIVNGLVRATSLEAEQLKTHMIQAGYAVFDEANILDLEARKILAAGGAIEIGDEGIMMIPPGYAQRSMHLDGAQLAFWDKNNMPSIAMGDLTQARQNIINAGMTNLFPAGFVDGSNFPQYGFLMMQGNIALANSVLSNSLVTIPGTKIADGSVISSKLGDGSVGRRKLAESAVGISQLDSSNIYVPYIAGQNVLRQGPYTSSTISVSSSMGWTSILTMEMPKKTDAFQADVLRVNATITATSGTSRVFQWRCTVNGTTVFESEVLKLPSSSPYEYQATADIVVDLLTYTSPLNIQLWGSQTAGSGATNFNFSDVKLYQNDQLPIRGGTPYFAVTPDTTPGGCQLTCQLTCQGACENSCQTSCEGSCQDTCEKSCETSCQKSCQATCETTSQSGGGCIREGTPIDVWDLETQTYITVPVEELKKGMILPWYQPETDTLIHGELVELQDALYSDEFIRIRTDNGPSVDVTFSQPFDVLADLGQGEKWHRLQAMYLRPGMKLIRPFENERPLSIIVGVETIREKGVHFWNPKTSSGGFCVNGYADYLVK